MKVVEEELKRGDLGTEQQLRLQTALKLLRPRSRLQQEARERAKWEARCLHDGYDQGKHTNPSYDRLAHTAIDEYLKLGDDPLNVTPEARAKALAAFKAVTDAGCRDLVVVTLYKIIWGRPVGNVPGPGGMINGLSLVLRNATYPAATKLAILLPALRVHVYAGPTEGGVAVSMLPEAAKAPELPKGELQRWAFQFFLAVKQHRARFTVRRISQAIR